MRFTKHLALFVILLLLSITLPALETKDIPIPTVPEAPEYQAGDDELVPVSIYELRNAVYHFELVKLYKNYSNELFGLLVTEISNCDTEHSLRVVAEKKLSNYQKAAVIYIPASLGIIAVLSLVLILK